MFLRDVLSNTRVIQSETIYLPLIVLMTSFKREGYSLLNDKDLEYPRKQTENEYQAPHVDDKFIPSPAFEMVCVDSQHVPKDKNTVFIYILTFFAALGGFLFGYDTGVISGAMILIEERFHLTPFWQELIVSLTVATAIPGALLSGWLADKYGRKPVLVSSSIIFTIGALVLGLAEDKMELAFGRIVVGFGIGLASTIVPLYIAEAAPVNKRGVLLIIFTLFITGGQCAASIIDGLLSGDRLNGWRYMLGLAGIPSTMMFVGFLFMPESPRWLIKENKVNKAKAVLSRIRGTSDVDGEVKDVTETAGVTESNKGVWKRMFLSGNIRKALIVGCGLQAFQQICGINTVMYYSATIIKMSGGISDEKAIWLAAVVAAGNFVFTIVGFFLIDRMGRRKLILSSLVGVTLSLILLGGAFYISSMHSPVVSYHEGRNDACEAYSNCERCINDDRCGFCYIPESLNTVRNGSCVKIKTPIHAAVSGRCSKGNETKYAGGKLKFATDYCPEKYAWLVMLGLVFYMASFAPGMGPVPWTMNSEIYPLWARSTAISCATTTNWVFNLMVSMSFIHLTIWLTKAGAFFLYAGVSILGWIFVFCLAPETKGISLEHVEELFMTEEQKELHNRSQSDTYTEEM